ncbi:hypothetical protein GX50_06338 [[Emmonsia] crescens]|uniref:Uncharacterized protein n=1 Tax=[Emmonsia] crescens TaxID=73230 RepID=A0A2B7Z3E0_9EURO|nr:hypothetical protein GX50_06338 [Emmonsia crescens]
MLVIAPANTPASHEVFADLKARRTMNAKMWNPLYVVTSLNYVDEHPLRHGVHVADAVHISLTEQGKLSPIQFAY